MEEYLQEKAEIATHILQEEWEAAHEKSLTLLQREPENIEFIVVVTVSSAYGGFFQDVVDYGKKALLWAENNGSDLEDLNSLGMSVSDIRELTAQTPRFVWLSGLMLSLMIGQAVSSMNLIYSNLKYVFMK